jgi:hypothetical protein
MLPIAPNLSHAESKRKPTNAELTGRQLGEDLGEATGGGMRAGGWAVVSSCPDFS